MVCSPVLIINCGPIDSNMDFHSSSGQLVLFLNLLVSKVFVSKKDIFMAIDRVPLKKPLASFAHNLLQVHW